MLEKCDNRVQLAGYYPGAIGHITECHATYYHDAWGFDISFEIQVGSEVSEFLSRFNAEKDGLWIGRIQNGFAGSIAIDSQPRDEEGGARLRWFITRPEYQGSGIGGRLIDAAMDFCKNAGHRRIFLWTFEGLDAARHLYEKKGFRLARTHPVNQWGRKINEQMFELHLP